MVSKDDFKNFVNANITEKDKESYKYQRKLYIFVSSAFSILIAFVIITVIVLALTSSKSNLFGATSIIITLIILLMIVTPVLISFIIFNAKRSGSTNIQNTECKIIDYLFSGYEYSYDKNKYITKERFINSPYMNPFDNYEGEDLLKVVIPNKDGSPSRSVLTLSDLRVTNTTISEDSNGHKTEQTDIVFSGTFGVVEFAQPFKTKLSLNKSIRGVKKLKTEDVNFNKNITLRAADELEAFCILTPTLIKKLQSLYKRTDFSMVIIDNKLYMVLYNNLFSFSYKPKELSAESFMDFYQDVQQILGIVEEISNNSKVFKLK